MPRSFYPLLFFRAVFSFYQALEALLKEVDESLQAIRRRRNVLEDQRRLVESQQEKQMKLQLAKQRLQEIEQEVAGKERKFLRGIHEQDWGSCSVEAEAGGDVQDFESGGNEAGMKRRENPGVYMQMPQLVRSRFALFRRYSRSKGLDFVFRRPCALLSRKVSRLGFVVTVQSVWIGPLLSFSPDHSLLCTSGGKFRPRGKSSLQASTSSKHGRPDLLSCMSCIRSPPTAVGRGSCAVRSLPKKRGGKEGRSFEDLTDKGRWRFFKRGRDRRTQVHRSTLYFS